MALGTIQTGTGLATGMDIAGTVDKLMALNAKPRDNLKTATDTLTTQKTALTTLAALLYAIKVPTTSLGKAGVYQERAAASSLPDVLAATVTGNPAILAYANKLAPTDRPDIGYAMIFPSMTILKILFVNIAAALM